MTTRTSALPENQPFVDAIYNWMEREGVKPMEICERVYGRDKKGNVKGTGALYPIFAGSRLPSPKTIAQLKDVLGLDLTKVEQAAPQPSKALTSVRAAVLAHAKVKQAQVAEPVRQGPPRFSLTIDQSGRATVSMHLIGISAEDATRCMSVLAGAGLIHVNV